jgi:hypothetical protein
VVVGVLAAGDVGCTAGVTVRLIGGAVRVLATCDVGCTAGVTVRLIGGGKAVKIGLLVSLQVAVALQHK